MEVVVSGHEGNTGGRDTADRGRTKAQPVPDKDWYRKWQEELHRKENQGSR